MLCFALSLTTYLIAETDHVIGEMLRENQSDVGVHLRPAFIAAGHPPETVDLWTLKLNDELANLKAHMYVRVSGEFASKWSEHY